MKRHEHKSVAVVYTGGTIGGKEDDRSHAIEKDLVASSFFKKLDRLLDDKFPNPPVLREVRALAQLSEEFYPEVMWKNIASKVREAASENPGAILVIHGTDTLAYTASFIAFACADVSVPIVFTGANESLTSDKTDAKQNLLDAFYLLSQEIPKGVVVSFSGIMGQGSKIHAGVKVRKVKFLHNNNSFASANAEHIAEIEIKRSWLTEGTFANRRLRIKNPRLWKRISEPRAPKNLSDLKKVTNKAYLIKVYPGFQPKRIDYAVELGTRGIILELYNSGTACSKGPYSIIPPMERCVGNGIPVFITSQQLGDVTLGAYGSSAKIAKVGALPLGTMTTECAFAKLTWLLSHGMTTTEVKKLMLTDFVGELFQ